MKGRNDTTTFLPLSPKIGGQVVNKKLNTGQYLSDKQTRYIYKKTESGSIINTDTLHLEIEQERQLDRIDDISGKTNPYKELIVKNTEKIEPLITQMEQWSVLNNKPNYIQYDIHPKNYHSLGISAVNRNRKNPCTIEERDALELDFSQTPDILREEYLDVYEGIQSEILNTMRFDENTDICTIYLGKADRSKNNKIKAEESFPISEQWYTIGMLLDGMECQLLLDTGSKEIIHAKIILHALQVTSLFTQVCIKNTKNSGRQW